jgi:hypothetical protein
MTSDSRFIKSNLPIKLGDVKMQDFRTCSGRIIDVAFVMNIYGHRMGLELIVMREGTELSGGSFTIQSV